jgi:type II secretory pathway predicted ATPase ExeA
MDELERKRQQLNELAELHKDLQHPAVLKVSEELDELIINSIKKDK